VYSEAIILLEQGIPETQVPATMPQGKAIDVRDRQFVVRLKDYFDQERHQGLSVSTQDPAGRVAKALGIGQRTVKAILSTYHQGGQIATPALESKGKPPYRIKPALETVIRQRIRELNRQGSHVSVRSLSHWLSKNYEAVPRATLGRTLQRMGVVYGKSLNKPVLRERDEVLIARRVYLRKKLANRAPHGGTVRPAVYLDESYVHVNHSPARTWYFANDGPWVREPSGKGLRLILVHAMRRMGRGSEVGFSSQAANG
jgi:transposase